MAGRRVAWSQRKKGAPEKVEGSSEADAAMRGLTELFSDPKLKAKAHFRYPVDGQRSEAQEALDAALEAAFGPNKEYERWVRRLHRLGLVNNRKGED
jgi:crotonobetainyl-CoA:carnitine CoA-transferase CaiB-like acyl-CoA transferase